MASWGEQQHGQLSEGTHLLYILFQFITPNPFEPRCKRRLAAPAAHGEIRIMPPRTRATTKAAGPDEYDPATRFLYVPHTVTFLIIGEALADDRIATAV